MSEYAIYDETKEKAPVITHDAARPFVVTYRYHRSYKKGMRTIIIGRYVTRKAAQQAIRRHSAK